MPAAAAADDDGADCDWGPCCVCALLLVKSPETRVNFIDKRPWTMARFTSATACATDVFRLIFPPQAAYKLRTYRHLVPRLKRRSGSEQSIGTSSDVADLLSNKTGTGALF
jgi:hypothetical protein